MNEDSKFKTHDYIAFFVMAALFVFGVLSYCIAPKDVDQVKEIVRVMGEALGMILSFKFGVHVSQPQPPPTPPPGGSITQKTEVSSQTPPDPKP